MYYKDNGNSALSICKQDNTKQFLSQEKTGI